jgi:hypothetical protein
VSAPERAQSQNGENEKTMSAKSETIQYEKEIPDLRTLPVQPSWQLPRPQLTLSDLIPGQYVSVTARVVYLRTTERQDALGSKTVFSGMVEDSTFKIPFLSHRITYPLLRNSIYKFYSAYVHEFEDKSLLLIITEHTKIEPKNIEDYREFVWTPKIESIKRPIHSIALMGVITTIHSNSGLVKRCNNCKSILYDSCPNNCPEGWGWDLRLSSRLYDGSGSIKMVLTKDIASRVLQRNLSEIILLANQAKSLNPNGSNGFQTSVCTIKIPETIEVTEAIVENASPSSYRKSEKLIITDGRNLVFLPTNEEHNFTDFTTRHLQTANPDDRKIIRRLIEKALEISVKKITENRRMHGIFLLEDPIPLYRCERAKLYLGFSARVNVNETDVKVELTPQAYVRESVLDYVNLRREKGASADAITRNLMTYRNRVIMAPSGNFGCITEVVLRKTGAQKVSDLDTRNLVEFWKQIYDIDISPDEIPLLKAKMVNSENTFTYPPSMCFFAGGDSLVVPAGVQKFIENKKSTPKTRMDEVAGKAIRELKIGNLSLGTDAVLADQTNDIQTQVLHETRQKLFGRNVSARGSILSVHDELWFFPSQIQLS